MTNQAISLLIVTAYVAGQIAALPHAHAAQDSDPHTRHHIHGARGHCHSDSHGHMHLSSRADVVGASAGTAVPGHHDDDCIFLPDSESATNGSQVKTFDALASSSLASSAASVLAIHLPAVLPGAGLVPATPDDALPSGANLCLILRTLRI